MKNYLLLLLIAAIPACSYERAEVDESKIEIILDEEEIAQLVQSANRYASMDIIKAKCEHTDTLGGFEDDIPSLDTFQKLLLSMGAPIVTVNYVGEQAKVSAEVLEEFRPDELCDVEILKEGVVDAFMQWALWQALAQSHVYVTEAGSNR